MERRTVFIVDDNDTNLMVGKQALEAVYRVITLSGAEKMYKTIERITPDIVLLDVDMPEIDGYQALSWLKADPRFCDIPVLFVSARRDAESEVHGFSLGAVDYVEKPFSAPVLLKRLETHIINNDYARNLNGLVREKTRQLYDLQNSMLSVIADMVEGRDKITGSHVWRTQKYLELLINGMRETGVYAGTLAGWDPIVLLPSAQLHDLGKISISDMILNKAGRLTEEEFEIIKTHTTLGEDMIIEIGRKTGEDLFLQHAQQFAISHHERWDGTGYPRRLKGEEIPLQGRMMAIADVYDALVSARPYKPAFTHEKAVEIIRESSGTHFDPKLVGVFLIVAETFDRVHKAEVSEQLS